MKRFQVIPGLQALAARYNLWPSLAVQSLIKATRHELRELDTKLKDAQGQQQHDADHNVMQTEERDARMAQCQQWDKKRVEVKGNLEVLNAALKEVMSDKDPKVCLTFVLMYACIVLPEHKG
jgi:hypothetical protein